ncbi:hypothetical protein GCM10011359_07150 [Nesterenkonia alkaliphila]|nr:hypothetical protein GCM10011359_07150 [Nesterenkonia alkaliphila]
MVAPVQEAATPDSMDATTSATAARGVWPINAWAPVLATVHTTDAGFGTENVKSNPARDREGDRTLGGLVHGVIMQHCATQQVDVGAGV